MSHTIYLVKFVIAYVGLIQILMLIPIWLITGRYFDNYWKLKEIYNPFQKFMPLIPKSMHRAMQYTLLIIIPQVGKKKCLARKIFGDFPFRERARLIDKIIALILVADFFVGVVFIILWGILLGISKIWGV